MGFVRWCADFPVMGMYLPIRTAHVENHDCLNYVCVFEAKRKRGPACTMQAGGQDIGICLCLAGFRRWGRCVWVGG